MSIQLSTTLPEPDDAAKQFSFTLTKNIQSIIEQSGGVISFADFFNLCLYTPNLGYYENALRKFGQAGDFVTAPELSPLFSYALANQCIELLEHLPYSASILEIGAGTGKMAADILHHLKNQNKLPYKYQILERSLELKEKQRALLLQEHPDYINAIEWLDKPPQTLWQGIVIGNEIIDALAVERFIIHQQRPCQLGVKINAQRNFEWTILPSHSFLENYIQILHQNYIYLPEGYISEYCAQLKAWLTAITSTLSQGACLFIDYGYDQREYFNPQRQYGTLRAHYRHLAHDDYFFYPGLQDLTAHANFTDLAEAALHNNFEVAGYTSQALFLYANGIEELAALHTIDQEDEAYYRTTQSLQYLLAPNQMGESFKVMLMTKELETPEINWRGFHLRDDRHKL